MIFERVVKTFSSNAFNIRAEVPRDKRYGQRIIKISDIDFNRILSGKRITESNAVREDNMLSLGSLLQYELEICDKVIEPAGIGSNYNDFVASGLIKSYLSIGPVFFNRLSLGENII